MIQQITREEYDALNNDTLGNRWHSLHNLYNSFPYPERLNAEYKTVNREIRQQLDWIEEILKERRDRDRKTKARL